jgi:hypothetical protein
VVAVVALALLGAAYQAIATGPWHNEVSQDAKANLDRGHELQPACGC